MMGSLALLDSTVGQFTADFLVLALVALNVYLGWRLGLLRRVVAFAGVYVGVLAASNIGNGLAATIAPHSLYANAWMFVGVVVLTVLIFEGLGWAFEERLQQILVFIFDRIVGTVAGLVVGISEALVLFIVALAVAAVPSNASNNVPPGRGGSAKDITSATLAGEVVRIAPQARTVFGPVLPSDLSTHLNEGTQITVPGI
ncbi:MAG: CvpA family protein [Candidatus Dormibacteria bacterium]